MRLPSCRTSAGDDTQAEAPGRRPQESLGTWLRRTGQDRRSGGESGWSLRDRAAGRGEPWRGTGLPGVWLNTSRPAVVCGGRGDVIGTALGARRARGLLQPRRRDLAERTGLPHTAQRSPWGIN